MARPRLLAKHRRVAHNLQQRKLPDLTTRVNSIDDFSKSTHSYINPTANKMIT